MMNSYIIMRFPWFFNKFIPLQLCQLQKKSKFMINEIYKNKLVSNCCVFENSFHRIIIIMRYNSNVSLYLDTREYLDYNWYLSRTGLRSVIYLTQSCQLQFYQLKNQSHNEHRYYYACKLCFCLLHRNILCHTQITFPYQPKFSKHPWPTVLIRNCYLNIFYFLHYYL